MRPPRILFHVQNLLGVGHLRRAAQLVRAMADAGAETILASGGAPLPGLDLGAARLVQLPVAQSADAEFSALIDENGTPIDEDWKKYRRDRLLQLFAEFHPDVVMVELYPFGRRPFAFELGPLLAAAHARPDRPLILCSLRDILVRKPDPVKEAAIAQQAGWLYDYILVHGDPKLVRLEESFGAAATIQDRLVYTGYVTGQAPISSSDPVQRDGSVLVSAGGGAVGAGLLRTALAARPLSTLRHAPWRLIGGWQMPPAEADAIAQQAAAQNIVFERHRPDFVALLQACQLSVSQAGYNTVMEILATRTRSVVVPFAAGAETEQSFRAEILARHGALHMLAERDLTPDALAQKIDQAAEMVFPDIDIDLQGAAHTASWIMENWGAQRAVV